MEQGRNITELVEESRACATLKIRVRVITQNGEVTHWQDSKMREFQSQESRHAGECSIPALTIGTC